MESMEAFKSELLQLLIERGWERVEVVEGEDWWVDEFWKIRSRRNVSDFEIVLTFLVDPMWDSPRRKGEGVWAVSATEEFPVDQLAANRGFAKCPAKLRFHQELQGFVEALDAHRNDRQESPE
jgi:hypothetical protein